MVEEIMEECYTSGTYKGIEWIAFYFERGIMQHFCGYVKIPSDHPIFPEVKKLKWYNLAYTAKKLRKMTKKSDISFPKVKFKSQRHYRYNYDALNLDVHGGLTFGEWVTKRKMNQYFQPFTPGLWVGWDYHHLGDMMYLPLERAIEKNQEVQDVFADIMAIHRQYPEREKQWSLEEVEIECIDACKQLLYGNYDAQKHI